MRIAIIGTGKMGAALAGGLARAGGHVIVLFDTDRAMATNLSHELGCDLADSASDASGGADAVLVCVKPSVVPSVLATLGCSAQAPPLVISIAAGVTVQQLEGTLPPGVPIIRAMPNTPALVGYGATAFCLGSLADETHAAIATEIFGACGLAVQVPESLMDAVTGLSGSGPAYVYLFIESLVHGGVLQGLPHATARKLAVQTVLGAAVMAADSDRHLANLKDDVTTPGGTTIAGLTALERANFRAGVIDAVTAAADRSRR